MNVIFGASGQAQEVDLLARDVHAAAGQPYRTDWFVAADDDARIGQTLAGAPVIGESTYLRQHHHAGARVLLGVGSPRIRAAIVARLKAHGPCQFPVLVHPGALFDRADGAVRLAEGALVCAGAVLTTDIDVGAFALVNFAASVGHNARIGAFATIAPGARISGNVRIGQRSAIGSGAVVLERLHIADDVVVGAGAVVTTSLAEPGTYIGVPARRRPS